MLNSVYGFSLYQTGLFTISGCGKIGQKIEQVV